MALLESRTGKSQSTLAEETLEEEKRRKKQKQAQGQKKARGGPSDVTGGGSQNTSFLSAGSGGGAIGQAIRTIGGIVDMNAAKKAARRAENRPEHRRMAGALDVYKEKKRSKQMGLATLSQAVFDWAAALR
ncbi:MAG: hypothetical protein KAJ19_13600 [Gammaproteobacteria bacterium]|nr:hypothetical protein [Gammaproteobacteria bacterium]